MSSPIFIKNPVVSTTGFIAYEVSAQFIASELALQECPFSSFRGHQFFCIKFYIEANIER